MSNYEWAANPIKLQIAVKFLADKKKIDPSTTVDEETVKAEYIRRAGLVLDVAQIEEVKEKKVKAKK